MYLFFNCKYLIDRKISIEISKESQLFENLFPHQSTISAGSFFKAPKKDWLYVVIATMQNN